MSNIFGLRSRRFTRFIDLVRLLSLPAEEELTLLRVPILAHGEDGWRSFWFFRFLMSLTPAISRTRSDNAQRGCPQGAPRAEFVHRVRYERRRQTIPPQPSGDNLTPPTSTKGTKEGRSAANSVAALRPRS